MLSYCLLLALILFIDFALNRTKNNTNKIPNSCVLYEKQAFPFHDVGTFFRVIEIDWHNLVDINNGQMVKVGGYGVSGSGLVVELRATR